MSEPISAVTASTVPAPEPRTPAGPINSLGQDAFMKLLVIQLQHQDPTAPKDDSQLLAQLAQFSSLEKLSSIDQTLSQLTAIFTSAASSPASSSSSSSSSSQKESV